LTFPSDIPIIFLSITEHNPYGSQSNIIAHLLPTVRLLVDGFFYHPEAAMIELNLTNEERDMLKNLLETCISDLRVEIVRTESLDYKDELKQRKIVLLKLLAALPGEAKAIPWQAEQEKPGCINFGSFPF
jgi:hypothetical protein